MNKNDRNNINKSDRDALSMLTDRIQDGYYTGDELTAIQTLDSIIATDENTVSRTNLVSFLREQKSHLEDHFVSELKYAGKLKRRAYRMQRAINLVNRGFVGKGENK